MVAVHFPPCPVSVELPNSSAMVAELSQTAVGIPRHAETEALETPYPRSPVLPRCPASSLLNASFGHQYRQHDCPIGSSASGPSGPSTRSQHDCPTGTGASGPCGPSTRSAGCRVTGASGPSGPSTRSTLETQHVDTSGASAALPVIVEAAAPEVVSMTSDGGYTQEETQKLSVLLSVVPCSQSHQHRQLVHVLRPRDRSVQVFGSC